VEKGEECSYDNVGEPEAAVRNRRPIVGLDGLGVAIGSIPW